jgi:DNA-binding transcriptional MerR regulator
MYISTKALARKTGASYRQIDYWCCNKVISPIGEIKPGQGNKREFDKNVVDRVALLVKASTVFDYGLRGNALKKIYDAYDEGYVDLGEGFILTWDNEKNSS